MHTAGRVRGLRVYKLPLLESHRTPHLRREAAVDLSLGSRKQQRQLHRLASRADLAPVPMAGGDARHTGQQPGPAPATNPRLAWRFDAGSEIYGSPALSAGRVFLTTKAGELVAQRRVLDGRNAIDPAAWRAAGWTYRALGRR